MSWIKKYIFTLIFPLSLFAIPLDETFDTNLLKGKKVGYYTGSFDPFHIGHQDIVEKALEHLDYVLVYPAPGQDKYKKRSDFSIRLNMIAGIYDIHPRVLYTNWSPKELQDKLISLQVIAILGSDTIEKTLESPNAEFREQCYKVMFQGCQIPESHENDAVGALMAVRAKAFIVAARDGADLSRFKGGVGHWPILATIDSPISVSSTLIREKISNSEVFGHLVPRFVQALIKEKGLYGYCSTLNSELLKKLKQMYDENIELIQTFNPLSDKSRSALVALRTEHNTELKSIIRKYGWPGFSIVGPQGASYIWSLVQQQEADFEFLKQCAELMKQSIDAREAFPMQYAYLIDHVLMLEQKPQIYGTQWSRKHGKLSLYQVEDRENLDKLRHEMNLPTIAEYRELLKTTYKLSDDEIEEVKTDASKL